MAAKVAHGIERPQVFELSYTGEDWKFTLTRQNDLEWHEATDVVAVDAGKPVIKQLVDMNGEPVGFVVDVEQYDVLKEAICSFYGQVLEPGEPPIEIEIL